MGIPTFMTVKQVSEYIQLNEKKIYALINDGSIPATRVTGKWMFPRELIDRWLLDSTHGGLLADRLTLVGADDPLLQRVVLRVLHTIGPQAMISYTPSGTRPGLSLLQHEQANASVIRWGADSDSEQKHPALLMQFSHHPAWVLIHLFRREQGLMITPPVARTTTSPRELMSSGFRWALRQNGSGGQRFLQEVLAQHHKSISELKSELQAYSEREAAAAITMDLADVAPGSRATANEFGLQFFPLGWESVDIVLPKAIWFRHLFQIFIKQLSSPETLRIASELEGYDLSSCSELKWRVKD